MQPLPQEARSAIREHAWSYYRRGWTVIPTRRKLAAIPWKAYQNRRPTEAGMAAWFGQDAEFDGVAVILGKASGGLACRDFDDAFAYENWAKKHPDLAKSLATARTDRGYHVYSRSEKESFKSYADGEYRADSKHYCILPPSWHPNGSFYEWEIPLPNELPLLDPCEVGLCPPTSARATQKPQRTQKTQRRQTRPPLSPPPTCPGLSGLSESSASHEPFEPGIEEAIAQTLPDREGVRNRRLFEFARRLKAIPRYADVDPRSFELMVREWHRRALPIIRTKPFEETWHDWLKGWRKVKCSAGEGFLDEALRRARRQLVPLIASRYDDPKMRLLVALVAELQRQAGDQPFFLACRSVAILLGVSRATVNRRVTKWL